ncbi:hypothetical protein JCGZ_19995 [Jatropha curcas]|uniref:Uncharacterized protein n=1 Tax=Jatropha curcas TaxID=180498 RepID=A0A067K655_JATCU|nr:hypothetical protein JCGZ_19995 [Jatropha curcas]
METLGVIPDIPVFEGDRVPVSRNALTPYTRPLQFLPASGSNFPVCYNTDVMHGFQIEGFYSCFSLSIRPRKPPGKIAFDLLIAI